MIFLDTETCGLHGVAVIAQYAEDDGEIKIWDFWTKPVEESLEWIGWLCQQDVVFFNAAFDWFHIVKIYNMFYLLHQEYGDVEPQDYIDELGELESNARDGFCLRPKGTCDLFLIARKTKYQSLMEREDIRIKRVPALLATLLANKLNETLKFNDVYFARQEDKSKRWTIYDIKDQAGEHVHDFKDVVLKFNPSSALKALAVDALGAIDVLHFGDIEVNHAFRPKEDGHAPFATAPFLNDSKVWLKPDRTNWYGRWPSVIEYHITHWSYNKLARQYASDDIKYTRGLYHFFGQPAFNDVDSDLATMVAAVRWKGYAVDLAYIRTLIEEQQEVIGKAQVRHGSSKSCREYLFEVMTDTEKMALLHNDKFSTSGIILEDIAKWKVATLCPSCEGSGCMQCTDGLVTTDAQHPAAIRAQEILDTRHAAKEIELYNKILAAGRLHASFKVIGALSGRMSGADSINAQGIKRSKKVRSAFLLAFNGEETCGGDFAGFEVVLMDAYYNDPELRKLLMSGKKIHGIFGTFFFPPMTYDDIMKTKGLPGEQDKYSRSKNGVFALCYGGEAFTLVNRVGVEPLVAEEAFQKIMQRFPIMGQGRADIVKKFCSISQPGGIGKKIEWSEPSDYVESMFGFKRYFQLENQVVKTLFALAQDTPAEWRAIPVKVVRRDREQLVAGAVSSALYGACFAIQGANARAAVNHVIQSSGAEMTKTLERDIWALQPIGIHPWVVRPMNVHDEILVVSEKGKGIPAKVREIVNTYISRMKPQIPLLEIEWQDHLNNWSEK